MTDHASEQAIQSIIEQFGQEHGVVEDRPTDTTHATQLSALIQAWINERAAPELLYYEEELVNALRTRLEAQMNMIDDRLDHATEQNALATVLYQTEVERVKFVLKSYLRARLYKIEKHALFILRHEDYAQRLSPDERTYAAEFHALMEQSYRASALDQLPEARRQLDDKIGQQNMIPTPDLDAAVFCRAKQPIGQLQLGNTMEVIDMSQGSITLLRYSYISQLLNEKMVELV